MKAVIIAGGKGTRLGLKDIPKPMVPLAHKPLLEYQILLLKKYGISEIIFLTGHLSEKIEEYFGNGNKWGTNISYVREDTPLGTGGAILQLKSYVKDRFLVFYGDVIMDFAIDKFIEFDRQQESLASLIVHPNDHPYDSDLVERSGDTITRFISKPHKDDLLYENLVNAAVYILSPDIFKHIPENTSSDFGKDIFPDIIRQGGKLRAYVSPEYIKDMGTPDRLIKVEKDLISGKIARWNLNEKRPAIFIDRDGVINKEVDNLRRIQDFELLEGVETAIRKINQSDFLAIIVTNQPAVAKGFLTIDELRDIHKLLETKLGNAKAFVNHIYFCPHHPDKGFAGEDVNLKINCDCRKPKIGLIKQAVEGYNIDLTKSFFIGDSTTDLMTAKNAGIRSILVQTGYAGKDNRFLVNADSIKDNLESAVDYILTLTNNKNDSFKDAIQN
jgi:mannose-1-phosphate guanylyltransferase/phosphomannomutase